MAGKSGASHDAPIRVALYARVSTLGKGQDTENQRVQLRQFATTQDWAIAQEYVDRVTGKHSDREQFQKLFADASQRRFDTVLFWSPITIPAKT